MAHKRTQFIFSAYFRGGYVYCKIKDLVILLHFNNENAFIVIFPKAVVRIALALKQEKDWQIVLTLPSTAHALFMLL